MPQEVETAPGIDFEALARLAEGYSGDDISGVCRDSAMASMRRKVAGKTPAEIRFTPLYSEGPSASRRLASTWWLLLSFGLLMASTLQKIAIQQLDVLENPATLKKARAGLAHLHGSHALSFVSAISRRA